jgi:hypothetical protein
MLFSGRHLVLWGPDPQPDPRVRLVGFAAAATLSRCGALAAWVSLCGRLTVTDVATGADLVSAQPSFLAHVLRFTPDGTGLVVAGERSVCVYTPCLATFRDLGPLPFLIGDCDVGGPPEETARVAIASNGHSVSLLPVDGSCDVTLLPTCATQCRFSHTGDWIVTTDFTCVRVWDARTHVNVVASQPEFLPSEPFFSDDCSHFGARTRHDVRVWDMRSGQSVVRLCKPLRPCTATVYSNGGVLLDVTRRSGSVRASVLCNTARRCGVMVLCGTRQCAGLPPELWCLILGEFI